MRVIASVALSTSIIEIFSLSELESHFLSHSVYLKSINCSTKNAKQSINIKLSGSKENIRKSVKALYALASHISLGIETAPARKIPENLQYHFATLKDREKYEKLYRHCADEYIKHCSKNDETPHPEVVEDFVY